MQNKTQMSATDTTLSDGLQHSADQVALLSRDLMNIEKNVNESISLILNTVQSDSEFRRKMVESFKQMSTLARQCKEGFSGNSQQGDAAAAIVHEENKFDSINSSQGAREKELVRIIDNLKIQLTTANEQIKQLQNGIREAEKTRVTLKSENRELGDMNHGYKVEIEKQMSIFERLNQLLQGVRAKVSKFLQTSDNVQHNINTYVADGILAEIRQDVLKSPQFSYIEQGLGDEKQELGGGLLTPGGGGGLLTPGGGGGLTSGGGGGLTSGGGGGGGTQGGGGGTGTQGGGGGTGTQGGGTPGRNLKTSELVKRVQDDIQSKWIQQLTALIADLETVISNMTSVGDGSSISTWVDYKTRLMEFLHLWAEKSANIIQSWIATRQKRSRKS